MEEERCRECQGFVYAWSNDRDTIFDLCGHLACPYWRAGLGPSWYAKARDYLLWQRRVRAEKALKESEPIPE